MSDEVPLIEKVRKVKYLDNDRSVQIDSPRLAIPLNDVLLALNEFQDFLKLLEKIEKDNHHFNYNGCSKWNKQFMRGYDIAYHDFLNDMKVKFKKVFGDLK